jgi:hypothetical protein
VRSKRRLPAVGEILLALVGASLLAGCSGGSSGGSVVLERGPWGGVGFSAQPSAGFWAAGSGPGDSTFYYGPVPRSARYAVLTASGYAPVTVPTRPLPEKDGLPDGRFFIVEPPGPVSLTWNITLRDSAGHQVAFSDF